MYIDYDIQKVKELLQIYEAAMNGIAEQLKPLEPHRPKSIKSYCKHWFDISLKDVRIATLQSYMAEYDHDSEPYDIINGVILYLKMQYTIKNYINCILRHENDGRVALRNEGGKWVLPNKQPISGNPEIIACEKGESDERNRSQR